MANSYKDKSATAGVAGNLIAVLLLILLLCTGCSDKNTPLAPGSAETLPVESSGQLEGRWENLKVFANGLPVTRYLIPAFSIDSYNARMTSYNTDLVVSVTGERTGLFSTIASGVAADTSNPLNTVQGQHDFLGSFRLDDQGMITVILPAQNPESADGFQSFNGTAFLAGDTLILTFTLAVPPEIKVGFLPDTTSFIARLVQR